MAFGRITEYSIKTIVSTQCRIAFLHSGMCTEAFLNSNLAIVKDDSCSGTAQDIEDINECIQKALFILTSVCKNYRTATVAQSGAKQIYDSFFAIEIDCSFTPIDLNRISRIELKWYKCKRRLTADFMDSTSDCRFAAFETFFFNEAIKNSSCGMSLFLQAFCFIFFEA